MYQCLHLTVDTATALYYQQLNSIWIFRSTFRWKYQNQKVKSENPVKSENAVKSENVVSQHERGLLGSGDVDQVHEKEADQMWYLSPTEKIVSLFSILIFRQCPLWSLALGYTRIDQYSCSKVKLYYGSSRPVHGLFIQLMELIKYAKNILLVLEHRKLT